MRAELAYFCIRDAIATENQWCVWLKEVDAIIQCNPGLCFSAVSPGAMLRFLPGVATVLTEDRQARTIVLGEALMIAEATMLELLADPEN